MHSVAWCLEPLIGDNRTPVDVDDLCVQFMTTSTDLFTSVIQYYTYVCYPGHRWKTSSTKLEYHPKPPTTLPCSVAVLFGFATPWITRKPSWRKGKRATAVRVWRPLAKKSTANLQLMVNSNRGYILLTVCELRDIFGCRGWKSSFSPAILWL